jgi:hypothetical protein
MWGKDRSQRVRNPLEIVIPTAVVVRQEAENPNEMCQFPGSWGMVGCISMRMYME